MKTCAEHWCPGALQMLRKQSAMPPRSPEACSHCFAADGQANTLPHYWDMEQLTDDGRYGRVYSEEEFLSLFGGIIGNGAAGPSNA